MPRAEVAREGMVHHHADDGRIWKPCSLPFIFTARFYLHSRPKPTVGEIHRRPFANVCLAMMEITMQGVLRTGTTVPPAIASRIGCNYMRIPVALLLVQYGVEDAIW